jgi:hypothetical protein
MLVFPDFMKTIYFRLPKCYLPNKEVPTCSYVQTYKEITCPVIIERSHSPSGLGGGGLGGFPRGSGGPKEGAASSNPLRERECECECE